MGIIDSILNRFKGVAQSPLITLGSLGQNRDYAANIDSLNYLDQFEGWTFKANTVKADAVSRHKQVLYKIQKDKQVKLETDPLLIDLDHFNDHFSGLEARKWTTIMLGLTGLAYWLMTEPEHPGQNRCDFYVLDPTRVTIDTDAFGLPKSYKFLTYDGGYETIDPANIIVFRKTNVKNWLGGTGELQASRYAHNSYELAMKYNMNMFGNSGRPEGFFILPGASEDTLKRFEKKLKQKYGGVENARKVGVMDEEIKYVEVAKTQKELDFGEGIKEVRDQILAINGVPKPLVGLTDSTFNNMFEAQRVFQLYTVEPLLLIEETVYNRQLIPKYYNSTRPELVFKHESSIEADQDKLAERVALLFEKNVLNLKQAVDELGDYDTENTPEIYYYELAKKTDSQDPAATPVKALDTIMAAIKSQKEMLKAIPSIKEAEDEKRDKLKAFYLAKNIAGEKTFTEATDKFFKLQATRILKTTKGMKSVKLSTGIDWDNEASITIDYFDPIFTKEAELWNDIANEVMNTEYKVLKTAYEELAENLEYFADEITQTTKTDLQKVLANAIDNGMDLVQLKGEIAKLFEGYIRNGDLMTRSEAIARTEVNSIKNMISRSNYSQNPLNDGYEWLTAQDADVRGVNPKDKFNHVEADGQVVGRARAFKVSGEFLTYPGDRKGSAGNVINCRCTVLPVINES